MDGVGHSATAAIVTARYTNLIKLKKLGWQFIDINTLKSVLDTSILLQNYNKYDSRRNERFFTQVFALIGE